MSKKPKAFRIEAEIFSTGVWNEEEFTAEDLSQIAANFQRLKSELKPPLKFGHDENQNLLNQRDGDPALGWVEQLRVVGDKLVATFAGIPEVVYQAIQSRRYRRVSAEIFFNVRHRGKSLGKALKAVALLGADLPAVTNLEDLTCYLTVPTGRQLQVGDVRGYTMAAPSPGVTPINQENTMSETLSQEDVEAELESLRAFKADVEKQNQKATAEKNSQAFSQKKKEVLSFCQEQVIAGKLPPHLHARLVKELESQVAIFSNQRDLMVSAEWVCDFIAKSEPILPRGEVAHVNPSGVDFVAAEENPSQTLARLASARMVEMHLNYGQAAEYVLKTNPVLANAYREYTLNPTMGD